MQITWERFARKHRDEGLDTRRVTCFSAKGRWQWRRSFRRMKMEEILVISDVLDLKRNETSFQISVLVSAWRRPILRVGKNLTVLERAITKKSAGWSSWDWHSKVNWQRSPIENGRQSSQDKWENPKSLVKWKEISHDLEKSTILVKEK